MGATTPEGKIKRKVTTVLKQYKVWYFMPAANGYGTSGIPDFIGIVHGKFLGIECKADATKNPTKLQALRGAEIRAAGGMWVLVRTDADIAALESLVNRMRT